MTARESVYEVLGVVVVRRGSMREAQAVPAPRAARAPRASLFGGRGPGADRKSVV